MIHVWHLVDWIYIVGYGGGPGGYNGGNRGYNQGYNQGGGGGYGGNGYDNNGYSKCCGFTFLFKQLLDVVELSDMWFQMAVEVVEATTTTWATTNPSRPTLVQ